MAALESISHEDSRRHVDILADDSFEGREAGSRGGRAAGNYLERKLAKYGLKPAGDRGTFFQAFGNSRNVLGYLPGETDEQKGPVVVIGAHYDHVGYGNRTNSFGPFGYVHNGADDNASGTAALLEIAQAMTSAGLRPRHSILFVFWDGEEKGLLGSKHWMAQPTIAKSRIGLYINLDMVGRLRESGVEVYGTRTANDLRQLVARANRQEKLPLDFRWNMTNNSDHYPLFQSNIPTLMVHTGLHGDYHRPQDDAHLINHEGIQKVARFVCELAWQAANQVSLAKFDARSQTASEEDRKRFEVAQVKPRGRLGISYHDQGPNGRPGFFVASLRPGGPGDAGGLLSGDQIVRFAGIDFTSVDDLLAQIQAAPREVMVEVVREGNEEPVPLDVKLDLPPSPVGIAWGIDPQEPGSVMLTRVTPGSVADQAGLEPLDRIYEVNGEPFRGSDDFKQKMTRFAQPTHLLVERNGILRTVTISLDSIRPLLPED